MTTSDGSTRNLADTNAQPAPERNDKPAVWSLVMRDMTERDIFGAEKYGTRLQPGNGRDFLLDAYQEALDLVVYLRGAIYERDELATVKESLTVRPVHIDPADVEISEQPGKCKGCFAGCRDCRPGFAKLQDEKLARMRADSAEQFINEVYDRIAEPASAIDDSSERMQAIEQNGEMADEVYAAVDQNAWANCELESLTSESRKYANEADDGTVWSERGRKFNMNRWRIIRYTK